MQGAFSKIGASLSIACMVLAYLCSPVLAGDDGDLQTLRMYYEGKDLVVSSTRDPKPVSQTAENITVVTAADIEMMGAHTLVDVLANVPGVQTDDRGSVGSSSGLFIQGADTTHILVLMDGVTLNFLGEGSFDIAAIPVQNIERVEIVRGPGSSSWGSALGGVINIVTKSPADNRTIGGALSFSAGERETRDSRGEVSGSVGSLGYYLSAVNLRSDGLRPHTAVDESNLYAKLRWELADRGSLLYTLAYSRVERGDGQVDPPGVALNEGLSSFLSTLSLNYLVSDRANLDLSLRTTSRPGDATMNALGTGDLIQQRTVHESTLGGSAKVSWRDRFQSIALGADFDHVDFNFDAPQSPQLNQQHLRSDKWGVFLNDTITIGKLTVTPGLRYDQVNPVGDFISPSLGAVWSLNDATLLRVYAARGYGLPIIVPGSTQEKVLTIQAGVETTQIPHLWLKTTLFRNYLSDVQVVDFRTREIVMAKEQKQGVEVEAKSAPLFNAFLSAGYTFVDATNRDSGAVLENVPRQVVKLGLNYDDPRFFRASLLGRYVWWNASSDNGASYNPVVWDLNLAKRLSAPGGTAVELFFNAHNIFNGAQYSFYAFKNPRRWVEGGVKFEF
ncbi:MAG TPA: TonB-dependent receptor [Geobacteraceae bacterium]